MAPGQSATYAVIEILRDGTRRPVTSLTLWSSNPQVLILSPSPGLSPGTGIATAVKAGESRISAHQVGRHEPHVTKTVRVE